jgi:hypothetical protein
MNTRQVKQRFKPRHQTFYTGIETGHAHCFDTLTPSTGVALCILLNRGGIFA